MDQHVLNAIREFLDNTRGHLAHTRGAWEASLEASGSGAKHLRDRQSAALLAANTVVLESLCEMLSALVRELGRA